MCAASMIYDHFHDKWNDYFKMVPAVTPWVVPQPSPISTAEIEEFRKLFDRARAWDKAHNQPDCELEEKREKLKVLSKELGVEISFV